MERKTFLKIGAIGLALLASGGLTQILRITSQSQNKKIEEKIKKEINERIEKREYKFGGNYFTRNEIKVYKLIQKANKNIGTKIDDDLLISIINTESTCEHYKNGKLKTKTGKHLGYMQITSHVATEEGHIKKDIKDPQKNIEIGASRLDNLIQTYLDEDLKKEDATKLALFSYNVGHTAVKWYFDNNNFNSADKLIEKLKEEKELKWYNRFDDEWQTIQSSKINEGVNYVRDIVNNISNYKEKINNYKKGLIVQSRFKEEFGEARLYNPVFEKVNNEQCLVVRLLPNDTRWGLAKDYTEKGNNFEYIMTKDFVLRSGQDAYIPQNLLKKNLIMKKY